MLLAAACNGARNESHHEPEIGPIKRVVSATDITLPLDAYTFSDREDKINAEAQHRLVVRCGNRFGVQVTMQPANNPPASLSNARRYGIIDSLEAEHGYRPRRSVESNDKSTGEVWNPSSRELIVVGGRDASGNVKTLNDSSGKPLPVGGCAGEAERFLGLPPPGVFKPNDLANESLRQSERDSRVKAAFKAWSKCMSRAGLSYASPWEPNDHAWPVPVSADEIATARADTACRLETNLVGIWLAVETAYQKAGIGDEPATMAAIKRWRDERIKVAARILRQS